MEFRPRVFDAKAHSLLTDQAQVHGCVDGQKDVILGRECSVDLIDERSLVARPRLQELSRFRRSSTVTLSAKVHSDHFGPRILFANF